LSEDFEDFESKEKLPNHRSDKRQRSFSPFKKGPSSTVPQAPLSAKKGSNSSNDPDASDFYFNDKPRNRSPSPSIPVIPQKLEKDAETTPDGPVVDGILKGLFSIAAQTPVTSKKAEV
jgi:hypothetical protein